MTPADVGKSQLEVLATSTERALAARAAAPDRVVDVVFDDLVADPVGTVRRVCERTGRDLLPAHVEAMERWLADNPRDKHGRHTYAAEDFGLTAADVAGRFDTYREQLAALASR